MLKLNPYREHDGGPKVKLRSPSNWWPLAAASAAPGGGPYCLPATAIVTRSAERSKASFPQFWARRTCTDKNLPARSKRQTLKMLSFWFSPPLPLLSHTMWTTVVVGRTGERKCFIPTQTLLLNTPSVTGV